MTVRIPRARAFDSSPIARCRDDRCKYEHAIFPGLLAERGTHFAFIIIYQNLGYHVRTEVNFEFFFELGKVQYIFYNRIKFLN